MRTKFKYVCFVVLASIYLPPLIIKNLQKKFASKNLRFKSKLYYILQWTSPYNVPFKYMGQGRKVFLKRNCAFTNCFVTSDKYFLNDYTMFDVIVFAGPELMNYSMHDNLPRHRSPDQKYVFASIEAPAYYPVCTNQFDKYFNWTWTFKLDSDSRWGYITIRDSKHATIGPNIKMNWLRQEDMLPVSDTQKNVLRGKTKLAVWFVSNCNTKSKRELFAVKLNAELSLKYNLSIEVYGKCGHLRCSRKNETKCDEMIRNDYYFYLSFENALSTDYVTEKLLHAVQYNAVPIVYGGANYSRFLPEGSYLNAKKLGVKKLAKKMFELFHNFDNYKEYFKWTNHYTYHKKNEFPETDDYCNMCALLNNNYEERSSYELFSFWWSPKCHITHIVPVERGK